MLINWLNFVKDRVLFFQNPVFLEIVAGFAVDFRRLWMCIKMQKFKRRPGESGFGSGVA